ncbi:DNA-binding response regulator [Vreelandella olivaria]|uniref:DNA-binding response regulator n=1 Tax=Vreelandella olivaria TaxID=390919 RepID=A0ABN5WQC3_9GAMM|nr:DNA-binding response regulator [Halomonas olivaria]
MNVSLGTYMSPTHQSPSSSPALQALVLIAEDEPEIADILQAYLKRAGIRTIYAEDGRKALDMHLSMKPDLVLLDVKMPKLDGWQVLSEVRHRGETPVIMLTAMDQDIDKLMGLRFGADDYVVKPFNPAEVVARIQAVLRRTMADASHQPHVLRVPPFEIDLEQHEAFVQVGEESHSLALTLTEFRLLTHLARAPKKFAPAPSCWPPACPRARHLSALSTAISASCVKTGRCRCERYARRHTRRWVSPMGAE